MWTSTHEPAQHAPTTPLGSAQGDESLVSAHATGGTHSAFRQISPAGQWRPHAPQFRASLPMTAQLPPQQLPACGAPSASWVAHTCPSARPAQLVLAHTGNPPKPPLTQEKLDGHGVVAQLGKQLTPQPQPVPLKTQAPWQQ